MSGSLEVLEEDQLRINAFSTLTVKIGEVEAQLEEKSKELRSLGDAADEATLALLPSDVMLALGDVFIQASEQEIERLIEDSQRDISSQLEVLKKRESELNTQRRILKAALYAKFGSQVNLEEE